METGATPVADHDGPTTPQPSGTMPPAPMDKLRRLRNKKRSEDTLTLEIPGYDGQMGVRYRSIPEAEIEELIGGDRNPLDLLIRCCDAICLKNNDDEWEPFDDGDGEGPLRFDHRLAAYFEIETLTEHKARETIEGVFNLDKFPLAAGKQVDRLIGWMAAQEQTATKGLLGE